MPRLDTISIVRRQVDLFDSAKRFVVSTSDLFTLATHLLGATKLVDAYSRRNVGQIVFEPGRDDLVVRTAIARVSSPGIVREPVQRHQFDSVCQSRIAGHGHTTFAGGNGFVGIE